MKKQVYAAVLSGMLVLASVVPAMAQSGTIEVTGGSLSITGAAIGFSGITLNGSAQNDVAGTTTAWTAEDATGTGAGWNLTIAATDFQNAALKTIPVAGFEVTLADAAIEVVDGNTKPTSSRTTPAALGTTAQKLVSAAVDTGMGTYTVQPTFTLDVPAATYAGTYTSTVTLQMVSAP